MASVSDGQAEGERVSGNERSRRSGRRGLFGKHLSRLAHHDETPPHVTGVRATVFSFELGSERLWCVTSLSGATIVEVFDQALASDGG